MLHHSKNMAWKCPFLQVHTDIQYLEFLKTPDTLNHDFSAKMLWKTRPKGLKKIHTVHG